MNWVQCLGNYVQAPKVDFVFFMLPAEKLSVLQAHQDLKSSEQTWSLLSQKKSLSHGAKKILNCGVFVQIAWEQPNYPGNFFDNSCFFFQLLKSKSNWLWAEYAGKWVVPDFFFSNSRQSQQFSIQHLDFPSTWEKSRFGTVTMLGAVLQIPAQVSLGVKICILAHPLFTTYKHNCIIQFSLHKWKKLMRSSA